MIRTIILALLGSWYIPRRSLCINIMNFKGTFYDTFPFRIPLPAALWVILNLKGVKKITFSIPLNIDTTFNQFCEDTESFNFFCTFLVRISSVCVGALESILHLVLSLWYNYTGSERVCARLLFTLV